MSGEVDWELIEDQIAVREGRLPNALKYERRARVLPLMNIVMQFATKLGISRVELAKELGVTRISLYHWQDGSAIPSMKNYCNLLRLCLELERQAFDKRV